MSSEQIIFYLLSAFILGMALLSVTTRHIFRSAIWLLFTLMGVAGLYFLLEVEFIAAVQIVVYVGGIVVLIIFSIFLTQQAGKEMPRTQFTRRMAAAGAVLAGFILSYLQLYQHKFQISEKNFDWSMQWVGQQMIGTGDNGYALPFEIISLLLLAAMIGCIVIALKHPDTATETNETPSTTNSETNNV